MEWNSGTYHRIENTLGYTLERAWWVALRKDANEVAVGFDEGCCRHLGLYSLLLFLKSFSQIYLSKI